MYLCCDSTNWWVLSCTMVDTVSMQYVSRLQPIFAQLTCMYTVHVSA